MDKYDLSQASVEIIFSLMETTLTNIVPQEYAVATAGAVKVAEIFVKKELDKYIKNKKIYEFKKDIYNIMYSSELLVNFSTCQKDRATNRAIEIIDDNIDEYVNNGTSFGTLYNFVYSKVEEKRITASKENKDLYTRIIVYSIVQLLFKTLEEDDLKKFEALSFIEFHTANKELQDRLNGVEEKVDTLSLSMAKSDKVYQILEKCSDHFTERLYLHKGKEFDNTKKEVNLKNLFVEPKVRKLDDSDKSPEGIIDFLMSKDFRESKKPLILIGNAGSGKTSILYRMAYSYIVSDEIKKNLFIDKELIIVRLRDLDKKFIAKGELYKSICNYLEVDWQEHYFDDKYVILDGMDEISSSEKYIDFNFELERLIKSFNGAYKLIITSRPGIITNKFDNTISDIYEIIPFDSFQKEEWIQKYEEVTETEINYDIKGYIRLNSNDTNEASIFDYPQLMYMIAGENPENGDWALDNVWSVFHHIFLDEIYDRNYEQDEISLQPFQDSKKAVYEILKKIGYEMNKYGSYSKISSGETKNLVTSLDRELLPTGSVSDAFDTYGYRFGCYWNIDDNSTEIEFYHNKIRDFFIAEYLFDQLNVLFKDVVDPDKFKKHQGTEDYVSGYNQYIDITSRLFDLLRCTDIHEDVVIFIQNRAEFSNRKREKEPFVEFLYNNFLITEENYEEANSDEPMPIHVFLKELTANLTIYNGVDNLTNLDIFLKISNFINNFISIMHATMYFFENDRINILKAIYQPYALNSIYSCFDFPKYINLQKANLRGIKLDGVFWSCANLRKANLSESVLSHADLSSADLIEADLSEIYADGIDLNDTNLYDAKLVNAVLTNAKLQVARLVNADLSGADLSYAYCDHAFFDGANLSSAILYKAVLNSSNLSCSKLSKADLHECNLMNADLRRVIFEDTNLLSTNLINAKYDIEEIKKMDNWELAIFE